MQELRSIPSPKGVNINWRPLLRIFKHMVVVAAEYDYAYDRIRYTAYSDLFREVEEGHGVPDYTFQFDNNRPDYIEAVEIK